jgi:hypothetical protein
VPNSGMVRLTVKLAIVQEYVKKTPPSQYRHSLYLLHTERRKTSGGRDGATMGVFPDRRGGGGGHLMTKGCAPLHRLSNVGGPQISLANRRIQKCGNLQICRPYIFFRFMDLRIVDPVFCRHETSLIHHFSSRKY